MSKRTKSILLIGLQLLYPKIISNVHENVMHKREQAKMYYDRTSKALPDLKKGDVVRVHCSVTKSKAKMQCIIMLVTGVPALPQIQTLKES